MVLKTDELKMIQLMRRSNKYATFKVEKRPTKDNPDGEIQRIVIEESVLLTDIAVRSTDMV